MNRLWNSIPRKACLQKKNKQTNKPKKPGRGILSGKSFEKNKKWWNNYFNHWCCAILCLLLRNYLIFAFRKGPQLGGKLLFHRLLKFSENTCELERHTNDVRRQNVRDWRKLPKQMIQYPWIQLLGLCLLCSFHPSYGHSAVQTIWIK